MKYAMGVHFDLNKRAGFALPTVLIASIIMLTVLLVAITSTSAVDVALRAQAYDQVAQSTSEAGLIYAKKCLEANNGVPQWSDEKQLMADTDCYGNQLAGCPVDPTSAACHFVMTNDSDNDGIINASSKFAVGFPSVKLTGFRQVEVGDNHTCATTYDSQIYCWGYNSTGRLGIGADTPSQSTVPLAVVNSGVLSGKTIITMSAGISHTCVIASDRNAYCWGQNHLGQLGDDGDSGYQSAVPVAVNTSGVLSGKTLLSIAAGEYFTCAIASNGLVYCWGNNDYGELGNNNIGVDSSIPVAVDTTNGVSSLYGKKVVSIATKGSHICALASDGTVHCWGWNSYGELGNNTETDSGVPVAVNTASGVSSLYNKKVVAITAGETHTCAIDSDSNAHCWGDDDYGQIGDNSTGTNRKVPVLVNTTNGVSALYSKKVLSMTASRQTTCAIASDNKGYCWGRNNYGQLGDDTTTDKSVPVAVNTTGNVLSNKILLGISAGYYHTCALASDGFAYCWGRSNYGQLGNSSTSTNKVPVAVKVDEVVGGKAVDITSTGVTYLLRKTDGLSWRLYKRKGRIGQSEHPWKQVVVGAHHSCALTSDGQAYCWGDNDHGQLGDNSINDSFSPVAVDTSLLPSTVTFKSIAAGFDHTCALASDNAVYCWGYNNYGQLGYGSTSELHRPDGSHPVSAGAIPSGYTIISISVGLDHGCVLVTNRNAYCWGRNDYGQVGDNTSGTDRTTPVAVYTGGELSGKKILSITLANYSYHTCAITTDGLLYCWGRNDYGQVGDLVGTTPRVAPTAVMGPLSGVTVSSVATGGFHTCAIDLVSKVYCWGLNDYGQIGDNKASGYAVLAPVEITSSGGLSGKVTMSIFTGRDHTCATTSDSNLYCWGLNSDYGEVGDNTKTDRSIPTKVYDTGTLAGKTVMTVSGGSSHTCAITYGNQAYCWGRNDNGQLGDGLGVSIERPVNVETTPYRSPVYF